MKQILFLALFCALSLLCQAQMKVMPQDSLRDADLLFVVNVKGNAITAVSEGLDKLPIDHVAIFFRDKNDAKPSVIQADYEGVRVCPLDSFLMGNAPDSIPPFILVGRVSASLNVGRSMANAFSFLGKAYDYDYLPDDKEIYCSELVQKSYVDIQGHAIFSTIPMTFRDANGEIPQFWVKHYQDKGIPIPEGEPGTNPGELSRRGVVDILGRLSAGKI